MEKSLIVSKKILIVAVGKYLFAKSPNGTYYVPKCQNGTYPAHILVLGTYFLKLSLLVTLHCSIGQLEYRAV